MGASSSVICCAGVVVPGAQPQPRRWNEAANVATQAASPQSDTHGWSESFPAPAVAGTCPGA